MRYSRFQIGCVIVEYDLFNATTFIQNLTDVLFGIILTQFYVNFSKQEHKINVLYVSFNLRFSGFSLYPLSFLIYSTFNDVQVFCSDILIFSFYSTNAQTFVEKTQLKIMSFQSYKYWNINTQSDNHLEGTVVNRALPSLHGELLTVPSICAYSPFNLRVQSL